LDNFWILLQEISVMIHHDFQQRQVHLGAWSPWSHSDF